MDTTGERSAIRWTVIATVGLVVAAVTMVLVRAGQELGAVLVLGAAAMALGYSLITRDEDAAEEDFVTPLP